MPTLQWIFKTATGKTPEEWSEDGELDWYAKYADSREDSGKGVLTADWNHFPDSLASESHRTDVGKAAQEYNWSKGRKFQDVLEHYGYKLEWSDQTTRCDHCYGCIQTDAQYYGDSAHYAILGDCDAVCEECIRKDFIEEYLEGLENNARTAVAIRGIDPAEYGYHYVSGDYENGFHPGQADNPAEIMKRLAEDGYSGIVFRIDSTGQFDVQFSVYAKGLPKMADLQRTLTEEYA